MHRVDAVEEIDRSIFNSNEHQLNRLDPEPVPAQASSAETLRYLRKCRGHPYRYFLPKLLVNVTFLY